MATYKVRSNGIEHTVNVLDNPGGGATVTVDDEHEFQVEFTGGEVETATPVKTSAERPAPASRPAPAAVAAPPASSAAGPGGVISPMPGKVISVKVAVGDTVAENDVVLSLEAMKMENNIVAHIAGSVARIEVSEGSEVAAGALLLVIEP